MAGSVTTFDGDYEAASRQWVESLTVDEREAARLNKTGYFKHIKGFLEGQPAASREAEAFLRQLVDDLDSAIRKGVLGRETVVYHAYGATEPGQIQLLQEGGSFSRHGYLSTSLDHDIARGYLEKYLDPRFEWPCYLLEVECPAGAHAGFPDMARPDVPFDFEVLLGRSVVLSIQSLTPPPQHGKMTYVKARVHV